MSRIVVAKLVRLGQDGNVFKKDMHAKTLRTSVKIDETEIQEFNKHWKNKGQLYIIDKEATEKRDLILETPAENSEKETPAEGHKLDGRKSLKTLKAELEEIQNN